MLALCCRYDHYNTSSFYYDPQCVNRPTPLAHLYLENVKIHEYRAVSMRLSLSDKESYVVNLILSMML